MTKREKKIKGQEFWKEKPCRIIPRGNQMTANGQPGRKRAWRRIFRGVLIFFGILCIGTGVSLHLFFTPEKLTPLVEKVVAGYLNAEVRFGKIELTFFSTFPNLGLDIEDAVVISGALRGGAEIPSARDSLMHVRSCRLTIAPWAYIFRNRIVVEDFILEHPEIHACVDSAGTANWEVLKPVGEEEETGTDVVDSTAFDTGLRLNNVRIRDGKLLFDDRSTGIYTCFSGLNLRLGGSLGAREADLKVGFSTGNVLFRQQGQTLVDRLRLGVETGMRIDRDSLLYVLEKAVFDVNGLRFGAEGRLKGDSLRHAVAVDFRYGIRIPTLKTLLDLVPETVLKKSDGVEVRGEVICQGKVKGWYGKRDLPLITSEFKIRDGYIAYPGMPAKIDTLEVDLSALLDLQKEQESRLELRRFCMKGGRIGIDLEGKAGRLLEDPVMEARLDAEVDLEELARIFPLAEGVDCEGEMKASLQGKVALSNVMKGNYGKMNLGGGCRMKGVKIFVPRDSLVMKVKSAGLVFASNRENRRILQGRDLLNGIVGFSGLDIHVRDRLHLLMDTTYLTLKTSPLRDTSAIASMSSVLHLGRTVFIVRDTLLVGLKKADVKAALSPWEKDRKMPWLHAGMNIDSLRMRVSGDRLRLAEAAVELVAVRNGQQGKGWNPRGTVEFRGMRAYTPSFPVRMEMPGTCLRFDANGVELDSAVFRLGRSDLRLSGRVTNLAEAFYRKDTLCGELSVASDFIDGNQLLRALELGTAYRAKAEAGCRDVIAENGDADDLDEMPVAEDDAEAGTSLFIVPAGLDFTFQTDIGSMLFGKLRMDSIHGEMLVRNRCIELSDLELRSSAANMNTSAIYRATDTLKAYSGFSLQMYDIRIDSLVGLIPALDTLFPMLRSFAGTVDFHVAADAWLDSALTIDLSSLRAAAYLDGKNLVLMDGETFSEISKMLMFKNKKRNMIDSISVELAVKDGTVEIFPFLVEIDRYKAAVGGQHNMDMTFKYHISLLESPLPFRAGMNISGSLEKMKFRITKAKYKNLFIPSRKARVDSTQLNLKMRIREMLKNGES